MTTSKSDFELNDPRVVTGWTMFDWANSAFALTIAVAIFPAYFEGVTAQVINPLGISMYNTTLFSLTVAVAYLLIAFVSPILSGIADSGGRRQVFLKFFTTLGAGACLSLFFFDGVEMTDGPMLALGVLGFLIGTMGYAGSLPPSIAWKTAPQWRRHSCRRSARSENSPYPLPPPPLADSGGPVPDVDVAQRNSSRVTTRSSLTFRRTLSFEIRAGRSDRSAVAA